MPPGLHSVVRRERIRFRVATQTTRAHSEFCGLAGLAAPPAIFRIIRLYARPRRRLLFYPSLPGPWHFISKVCGHLGYAMTSISEEPHDLIFSWKDATTMDPRQSIPAGDTCMINRRCLDISKRRVAAVFEDVFGYPLEIDPATHEGPLLEKSDGNFTHDGRIVNGPLPTARMRDGFVYQRLIDNRQGDGTTLDLRVAVVGGRVPSVVRRYRLEEERFGSKDVRDVLTEPREVLSAYEIGNLIMFCRRVGLDVGDLDVLRDRADGRIYIVDTNKTPASPDDALHVSERRRLLTIFSEAFEDFVEEAISVRSEPVLIPVAEE